VLGISPGDLLQVGILGAIVLAIVLVMRKELLFATFDPLGAAASGLPVAVLEYLLLALLGVTIVVSIQAVGIIMVVAMLVTSTATPTSPSQLDPHEHPHDHPSERRLATVDAAMDAGHARAHADVWLSDVSAGYDGRAALEHVDVAIEAGSLLAVVGPNGAGK